MSNYTVTTNFLAKDSLASGNPSKAVRGADLTTEFSNIATMSTTKVDTASAASLLSLLVTGSSAPANGIYLPAANTFGIATNSIQRLTIDASGNLSAYGPLAAALQDITPDSGSFSSTTSGAFIATFTWKWRRVGKVVWLWTDAGSGAQTASAAALTLNSLPAAIQPTSSKTVIAGMITGWSAAAASSFNCVANVTVSASANWTINQLTTPNSATANNEPLRDGGAWIASGAGGAAVNAGFMVCYPLS